MSEWHNVWVAECLLVKMSGCQNVGCQNVPVSKGQVPKCRRIPENMEGSEMTLPVPNSQFNVFLLMTILWVLTLNVISTTTDTLHQGVAMVMGYGLPW